MTDGDAFSPLPERYNILAQDFYRTSCTLLSEYPDALIQFKYYWSTDRWKFAHNLVFDMVRQHSLVRSSENEKIDDDFFWLWLQEM
jgi:hypothetical protein